ncbi:MAG: tetratricopeptide repeat protein [Capsulimonas sp.]|uniref:tetratricopeptide repeat protein n=1 Tax=Capsulimonas sp. TaxID=2494211 RepID=UPI003264845D
MMGTQNSEASLAITLFGPMQAFVDGRPLPPLRSRKSRWLLALLVLRHGHSVERAWLCEMLWLDAFPDRSAANLNPALSDLRRALGSQSGRVQSPSRHTLRLDLGGASVDLLEFDAAIDSQTPEALERAAALYRGPLLEGCNEEWALEERTAREQECLKALETLAGNALAAGDHTATADYYRRAIRIAPLWEAAQRGLMQALFQAGDDNAALSVYRTFAQTLRRDDPRAAPDEQTTALYSQGRAEMQRRASLPAMTVPKSAPSPKPPGYLPKPLTDLIGRKDERAEVMQRIGVSRLVTLTGPGGIGKTRLALTAAEESAPQFVDGVWLAALETLSDGASVVGQIASVLNLKETPDQPLLETLIDYLRHKDLLLVLDNCEHLLDAIAQTADRLLRECGGVRVLATSREALRMTGEVAWQVPSLSTPDPAHLPQNPAALCRALMGYESVQLFVERAQAARNDFALTGANAAAVAEICARLEGAPLAIELAAARIRAMTAEQMAARLDDHLTLLSGGSRAAMSRQQTMRATLDWSFALLTVQEQILLARVSVFSGGWTLEAAEAVCAGDDIPRSAVLDLLTSLVDKSLIIFDGSAAAERYRMLETVRQYGAEHLQEGAEVCGRHLAWAAALVEAATQLRGAELFQQLAALEAEYSNLAAALAWVGMQPDTDTEAARIGLSLAGGLSQYWHMHALHVQGRRYLIQALDRPGARETTAARARALNGAGVLSYSHGDYSAARGFYSECLDVRRQLDDGRGQAVALNNLGNVALILCDPLSARALFEEAQVRFQDAEDVRGSAQALSNLANVAYYLKEYETSRNFYEQVIVIFQSMNDTHSVARTLGNLGNVAYEQADYTEARVRHEQSLDLFREFKDYSGVARQLVHIGNAMRRQGEDSSAEALYEEALGLFRQTADQQGVSEALTRLGFIADKKNKLLAAKSLHQQSLEIGRSVGYKLGTLDNLKALAGIEDKQGRPERAVRLWAAAHSLGGALDIPPSSDPEESFEWQTQSARAALSEAAFTAAQTSGALLTWEQAVAYALEGYLP